MILSLEFLFDDFSVTSYSPNSYISLVAITPFLYKNNRRNYTVKPYHIFRNYLGLNL